MLEIDAAFGGPFDMLGKLILASGQDDSSGYRRSLASRLARSEFDNVARSLGITTQEAEQLRAAFVAVYGEPCDEA